MTIAKCVGLWLILVVAAIANGVVRDLALTPVIGEEAALPLSGVTLSILVLGISFVSVSFLRLSRPAAFILVGISWVLLTLAFEFLFGRFVVGKSWDSIMKVFNVADGNLFVVVLLVTAISPWLTARWRGLC